MTWDDCPREAVEVREHLAECGNDTAYGTQHHRPLSVYLNQVIALECRIAEVAEPGIDPATAAAEGGGAARLVHVPNTIVIAADRA